MTKRKFVDVSDERPRNGARSDIGGGGPTYFSASPCKQEQWLCIDLQLVGNALQGKGDRSPGRIRPVTRKPASSSFSSDAVLRGGDLVKGGMPSTKLPPPIAAAMKVFNLYIFDRKGACIFYREWNRERSAGSLSRQEVGTQAPIWHQTAN